MEAPNPDLQAIDTYFQLIQSSWIPDLKQAEGMLDSVLNAQDGTYECHTDMVITATEEFYGFTPDYSDFPESSETFLAFVRRQEALHDRLTPYSDEANKYFITTRLAAVSHVIRAMIQGGKINPNDFDYVIESALRTASLIDGKDGTKVTRRARTMLLGEVDDVLSFSNDEAASHSRAELAKELLEQKVRRFTGKLVTAKQRAA